MIIPISGAVVVLFPLSVVCAHFHLMLFCLLTGLVFSDCVSDTPFEKLFEKLFEA